MSDLILPTVKRITKKEADHELLKAVCCHLTEAEERLSGLQLRINVLESQIKCIDEKIDKMHHDVMKLVICSMKES